MCVIIHQLLLVIKAFTHTHTQSPTTSFTKKNTNRAFEKYEHEQEIKSIFHLQKINFTTRSRERRAQSRLGGRNQGTMSWIKRNNYWNTITVPEYNCIFLNIKHYKLLIQVDSCNKNRIVSNTGVKIMWKINVFQQITMKHH